MENGLSKSNNGRFQMGNSGRKKGSKNKAPNQEALNDNDSIIQLVNLRFEFNS